MNNKILIVDDEKDILFLLRDFFTLNDFDVFTASDAMKALELIDEKPDIILLDVNMPEMNGIELCKRIRNKIECPIIFLTARTESEDVLQGLSVGGDDYITKPFNVKELLGRVQAHLRRENRILSRIESETKGLRIDYSGMAVSFNGRKINFTKTEFAIIELLSLHPGRIFDREKIYEAIRGFDAYGDNTVITEHIRKIRNKFIAVGGRPYIETVWGVGYKWIK